MYVQRLEGNETPVPTRATEYSAGFDLCSNVDTQLEPGEHKAIGTGFNIGLRNGTVGLVTPRSGMALKHGVTVLNSPGTIDSDYRGELMVILINHGKEPFVITKGMRIAQLVITEYNYPHRMALAELNELPEVESKRTGGFGSTGA